MACGAEYEATMQVVGTCPTCKLRKEQEEQQQELRQMEFERMQMERDRLELERQREPCGPDFGTGIPPTPALPENGIEFSCPSCEAVLEAELADAGSESTCPQCGARVAIPSPPPARPRLKLRRRPANDFASTVAAMSTRAEDVASHVLGAMGGGGSEYVARNYLRTEMFTSEVTVPGHPDSVLTVIANAVSRAGTIQFGPAEEELSLLPHVAGVVGSGFLRMNPCFILCELTRKGQGDCVVRVTGGAKEGLIKQRTAEKAVTRIVQLLARMG